MRIPLDRAMHKDLFGPKIEAALAALPTGVGPLQRLDHLRRLLPADLAREAAALHDLRQRCKPRIGLDLLPFLRAPNASQVTPPAVAARRAQRIAHSTPDSHIWDCTAGLGMEAVHLHRAGLALTASDRELEIATFAAANLAHHGSRGRVLCTDALHGAVRADGILIDPDRRVQGKRSLDPSAWSPTLDASWNLARKHTAAVLKLPPVWEPPADWRSLHDLEVVSLAGHLVETTLWLGRWAGEPGLQAVRIESDGSVHTFAGRPGTVAPLDHAEALASAYLFDPDPSLAAAGLLESFASHHGFAPLAEQLGYLGGPEPLHSPFGQCFRILGHAPLRPKAVQTLLGEHEIGPIEVRVRGHQERPEQLARRLRGPGQRRGQVAVARLDGGRRVFLLEPCASSAAQATPDAHPPS